MFTVSLSMSGLLEAAFTVKSFSFIHSCILLLDLCLSDKTSKHFDLQCLNNAKGIMHFGGIDYLYEKDI